MCVTSISLTRHKTNSPDRIADKPAVAGRYYGSGEQLAPGN